MTAVLPQSHLLVPGSVYAECNTKCTGTTGWGIAEQLYKGPPEALSIPNFASLVEEVCSCIWNEHTPSCPVLSGYSRFAYSYYFRGKKCHFAYILMEKYFSNTIKDTLISDISVLVRLSSIQLHSFMVNSRYWLNHYLWFGCNGADNLFYVYFCMIRLWVSFCEII